MNLRKDLCNCDPHTRYNVLNGVCRVCLLPIDQSPRSEDGQLLSAPKGKNESDAETIRSEIENLERVLSDSLKSDAIFANDDREKREARIAELERDNQSMSNSILNDYITYAESEQAVLRERELERKRCAYVIACNGPYNYESALKLMTTDPIDEAKTVQSDDETEQRNLRKKNFKMGKLKNNTKPVKLDLFGDPIPLTPACKNCGKKKYNHRASDQACPFGSRDRTGGFSFPFGAAIKVYEPRETKKPRNKTD